MKITKLPLSISVLSLLAVLPATQASEVILNCTAVSAVTGQDTDSTPGNHSAGRAAEDDEACAKVLIPLDYGDAPAHLFPTLLAHDGARHQLGAGGPYLGSCVDADSGVSAKPDSDMTAALDDQTPSQPGYGDCSQGDDEEGVSIGPLAVGANAVPVEIEASAACKLNAWVDWNADHSWSDTQEQIFKDQPLLMGRNTLSLTVPATARAGEVYARFRCSSAGGDSFTGEAEDGEVEDYRLTLAADPRPDLSLGNFIWLDANRDGVQGKGEYGLVGAVVSLLNADGTPARDRAGQVLAEQQVDASGLYQFKQLAEGEYLIRVRPPQGYVPTQGGIDADSHTSDTDSNCVTSPDGIQTLPFSLAVGTEPDVLEDGDGPDSNQTLDCGFHKAELATYSIGNQVWVDDGAGLSTQANNGIYDPGERVVADGVVIDLYDANSQLLKTVTTRSGYYLFSGLASGSYKVCVSATNFSATGVLAAYTASTGGDGQNPNYDRDGVDNGDNDIRKGLCSPLLPLGEQSPLNEAPTASGKAGDDGMGTLDQRSNLSIDFAVLPPPPTPTPTPIPIPSPTPTPTPPPTPAPLPLSLGDRIWFDSNADGIQDTSETGLAGVSVSLVNPQGLPVKDLDGKVVTEQVTTGTGTYLFERLPAGEYVVNVRPPAGYYLSTGGLDVDAEPSNNDSNCLLTKDGKVQSLPLTLAAGTEPDAAQDGDGVNSNRTVDCGFFRPVSVGDWIWQDRNANGEQDAGEPGLAGMTVQLLAADGQTPATDLTGQVVKPVLTAADGKYQFEGLRPGSYTLQVTPERLGYQVSPIATDPASPSATDNHCKAVGKHFQTAAFKILRLEGTNNGLSNSSIDCGFYRPVGVGNRVWLDLDGNGRQDSGEPGLANVMVKLLDRHGKAATDWAGQPVPAQLTDASGKYFFGHLAEGEYVIALTPPAGYSLTLGGTDPNNDNNQDSNGIQDNQGRVVSLPVNLQWGKESVTDGDNDPATNLTVGFGFVPPASLGIPTLGHWALGLLSLLLSGLAWRRRRQS